MSDAPLPQNAQWVTPLMPGDIPEGTRPVWNVEKAIWEFFPLVDQYPTRPLITPTTP